MNKRKMSAQTIALTGVLAAVALLFQMVAGFIPVGWMGVTAVSGLVVAMAVATAGYTSGIFCWLVSGLLGLILAPAKQVPLLFLSFLGIYPVFKNWIERIKIRPVEFILKLACFNLAFVLLYRFAFVLLFQDAASDWIFNIPIFPVLLVCGNVIFLIYDFAFSRVMVLIQARLVIPLRRRMH